jgi:hypothetical protein
MRFNPTLEADDSLSSAAGNALEVSTTQPDGFQGGATYNASNGSSDTGTAVFGAMDFTTTGPLVTPPPPPPAPAPATSPYFPASGPVPPESFTYQAISDSDTLAMDITWTSVVPNAPSGEPQLFGTGKITSIAGDDIFKMDFGMAGDLVSIGANFPLTTTTCDLTRLAARSCTANFLISSYEGGDATPLVVPPHHLPPSRCRALWFSEWRCSAFGAPAG